jgi:hypothetical protein
LCVFRAPLQSSVVPRAAAFGIQRASAGKTILYDSNLKLLTFHQHLLNFLYEK